MFRKFIAGLLAATLGVAAVTVTMWTLTPTALPESSVYANRAEIGLVEPVVWLAHLQVAQAEFQAANDIIPGS